MRGSRLGGRKAPMVMALTVAVVFAAVGALLAVAPSAGASSTTLTQPILIAQPTPGDYPETPRITAKAALLMDMDSGTVLYSRNADKQLEMASTTKIMTAILILESMPLDDTVTVPAAATGVSGSALGLRKGEKFTVEQLLYMMLVPSANDAAVTLAVAEAGSVQAFAAKMNDRAQKMGLTNTHYVNDCGLHAEGHYSSARDTAKLAAFAMRNPVFRRIVSTKEFTIPLAGGVTDRVIKTSNELLQHQSWVNGIKTGSTPWAGYCLVSSTTTDGMTLISVVLGAKDQDTRESESRKLLTYGLQACALTHLVDKGDIITEVPVEDPLGRQIELATGSSYSHRLLGTDSVTGMVKLDRELTLPVKAGEVVGELDFFQAGAGLGSVPLVAAQSMEPANLQMIIQHWRGSWFESFPLTQFFALRPAA